MSTHHDIIHCGGWTLVWSNLRENSTPLQENMTWVTATSKSNPKYIGTLGDNKELFQVYTPLEMWNTITQNRQMDFRYEWRINYGQPKNQEFKAKLEPLSSADYYKLKLSNYIQIVGSITASIYLYHNYMPFSTYDKDNDNNSANCSSNYSSNPFWFNSCWSGSIFGFGVYPNTGYFNGAYWNSSDSIWGTTNGAGAGNGWFYIR